MIVRSTVDPPRLVFMRRRGAFGIFRRSLALAAKRRLPERTLLGGGSAHLREGALSASRHRGNVTTSTSVGERIVWRALAAAFLPGSTLPGRNLSNLPTAATIRPALRMIHGIRIVAAAGV